MRWIIEYANDIAHRVHKVPSNPIMFDGSSHYRGTLARYHPSNVYEALSDNGDDPAGYKVFRLLPKQDENDNTAETINMFAANLRPIDRIIYIDPRESDTKMLVPLNMELKTDWLATLETPLLGNWKKGATKLTQLERWEQREFLCGYYPGMVKSLIELTEPLDRKVLTLTLDDVVYRAHALPAKLMAFLGLPPRIQFKRTTSHIEKIHHLMYERQESVQILSNVHTNFEYIMSDVDILARPMSLLGEAMLQQLLLAGGMEMRCHGVNQFPITTMGIKQLIK